MRNLLWGTLFIVVGVIFGLNALDITDINIFFDGWWTLFIIVPCTIDLFKEGDKTGNMIGIIIGVLLLLSCQNIIEFDMILKLIIPFILVAIGLSFIFKGKLTKKVKELNQNKNLQDFCGIFSSQNVDFSKEEFKGCNLTAVFGGVKCDLKDAIIKEDMVINASSIFGGVSVLVPDNVNVKVVSTSIFGGVSDERKNKSKDNKKTIYINALCLFGGVDIK